MPHIKKEEFNLFPTPVSCYNLGAFDISDIVDVKDTITTDDHALVENGTSSYIPDCGKEYFLDKTPKIKEVIQMCVNDHARALGFDELDVGQSWCNKTPKGGRLDLHIHNGSVLSGAYYPILTEEVAPLLFRNPLYLYKTMEWFKYHSEYATVFHPVQPYQGLLVLFPSWLDHKTETEIGERFVVSFNTKYRDSNETLVSNQYDKVQASC